MPLRVVPALSAPEPARARPVRHSPSIADASIEMTLVDGHCCGLGRMLARRGAAIRESGVLRYRCRPAPRGDMAENLCEPHCAPACRLLDLMPVKRNSLITLE